jgi:rhodanese-related sulfurtransferase
MTTEQDTAAEQAELSPREASERATEAQVVDVRTDEEHAAGYIAETLHIPLDRLTEEAERLDRDRPVIFYCRGGERSATAAAAFRASGWDAYNIQGGLVAWAEEGLPLEPEGGKVAERSYLPPA